MTTLDLTTRLLPLPASEFRALVSRLPKRKDYRSAAGDYAGGGWYVHRGDLVINGSYDHTLPMVVDGNLTVQGTLDDSTASASLIVLGDLRCKHLLSRYFLCITGSLRAGGLVYLDYNDHPFEVWGPALSARILVISDRSCLLPEARSVEAAYDSDETEVEFEFETARSGPIPMPEGPPADIRVALRLADCGADRTDAALADPALHLDLALSPAASTEQLARLATSSDSGILAAVASHPRAPREAVTALAKHRDAAVRAAVVHHPELTEAEAARLGSDRNADVRRQIAASRHAAGLLAALVTDKDAGVRRAVASHPALSDEQRRQLLADRERAVVRRALTYLPQTEAWVEELLNSGNELLAAWAVEHRPKPKVRAGGWRERMKDLLDPRRAVREATLREIPKSGDLFRFLDEHRETIANDESDRMRTALAAVTRDAAMLDRLSRDRDASVRRSALANFAIPEELLLRETARVCGADEIDWDAIHTLLGLPHLPAAALNRIHAVYPRSWLLEAHRNMPLDVILSRAEEVPPEIRAMAAGPEVFALMLDSGIAYLERAARPNGVTPLPALLSHARMLDDTRALAAIASNPGLNARTRVANELLELLFAREDKEVFGAIARNPDLPQRVLREAADREGAVADTARITIWQVWGERL